MDTTNSPIWQTHTFAHMIREDQIDSLGHLHNLEYLKLFESARWQMIFERGFGFDVIHKMQQGPIILGISVQYRKEVLLRQKVEIRSTVLSYEGKICKIRQQLFSESNQLHCEAEITTGFFDMNQRKLIIPTPEWLKACGKNDL